MKGTEVFPILMKWASIEIGEEANLLIYLREDAGDCTLSECNLSGTKKIKFYLAAR